MSSRGAAGQVLRRARAVVARRGPVRRLLGDPRLVAARQRLGWRALWPGADAVPIPYAPGHFYSPIPSAADVDAWTDGDPSAGLPGIDLRVEEQVGFLQSLAVTMPAGPRFTPNGYYDVGDAAIYQAIVRTLQPARVVEIGGGWSTAALLDAPATPQVTVIDPDPSRVHSVLRPEDLDRCTVLDRRLQDIDDGPVGALQCGDILFVDSSHVGKVGSDVSRIMFDVLPRLPSGVVVHFHDVWFPFEYRQDWLRDGLHWNEAYLVRAFLTHNDAYEILLWPDVLRRLGRIDDPELAAAIECGASAAIWIRRR